MDGCRRSLGTERERDDPDDPRHALRDRQRRQDVRHHAADAARGRGSREPRRSAQQVDLRLPAARPPNHLAPAGCQHQRHSRVGRPPVLAVPERRRQVEGMAGPLLDGRRHAHQAGRQGGVSPRHPVAVLHNRVPARPRGAHAADRETDRRADPDAAARSARDSRHVADTDLAHPEEHQGGTRVVRPRRRHQPRRHHRNPQDRVRGPQGRAGLQQRSRPGPLLPGPLPRPGAGERQVPSRDARLPTRRRPGRAHGRRVRARRGRLPLAESRRSRALRPRRRWFRLHRHDALPPPPRGKRRPARQPTAPRSPPPPNRSSRPSTKDCRPARLRPGPPSRRIVPCASVTSPDRTPKGRFPSARGGRRSRGR